MIVPYYTDESVTLYQGDALAVLSALPAESANCVVTSPPYYGLRDYGEPGQYGLEPSPAEYVETMRKVFAEVRRVLANDGTLWLNLGDSYARGNGQGNAGGNLQGGARPSFRNDGASVSPARRLGSLPPKSLLGIPWRVAFALQDDSWTLRNDIVWHKPNAMPASVTDRVANRHEHVFLFAKSERYHFNLDAIRVPHADKTLRAFGNGRSKGKAYGNATVPDNNWEPGDKRRRIDPRGVNPGDVWTISTEPYPETHFAVFPPTLAERCIVAGCKPGGVVLDPFCGSGTTGMVAQQHGRRFVGVDLSRDYLDLALRTRLAQTAIVDAEVH